MVRLSVGLFLSFLAALVGAVPPDFTTLTSAIDTSTLITAVLAVAVIAIGVILAKNGAIAVMRFLGRAK